MRAIVFGGAFLLIAGILITSPYWLFREMTRPDDESLPNWMGDAQARKKRLIVIVGVLALVAGAIVLAAGLSER